LNVGINNQARSLTQDKTGNNEWTGYREDKIKENEGIGGSKGGFPLHHHLQFSEKEIPLIIAECSLAGVLSDGLGN